MVPFFCCSDLDFCGNFVLFFCGWECESSDGEGTLDGDGEIGLGKLFMNLKVNKRNKNDYNYYYYYYWR